MKQGYDFRHTIVQDSNVSNGPGKIVPGCSLVALTVVVFDEVFNNGVTKHSRKFLTGVSGRGDRHITP